MIYYNQSVKIIDQKPKDDRKCTMKKNEKRTKILKLRKLESSDFNTII